METEKANPKLEQIEDSLKEMTERLEPIHTDPLGQGRPRILPTLNLKLSDLLTKLDRISD